jgi:hypothetical protein
VARLIDKLTSHPTNLGLAGWNAKQGDIGKEIFGYIEELHFVAFHIEKKNISGPCTYGEGASEG